MKTRDISIDALRALAIILIMIAHTYPFSPNTDNVIYNLREFDVPMMAFLLGASFVLSTSRSSHRFELKKYLLSRFKRLVIPTWVFGTIVILAFLLLSIVLHKHFPFTTSQIFGTYFLTEGIGYIWIIRVFVCIALFIPFTNKALNMIRSPFMVFLIFSVLICLQTLLVSAMIPKGVTPGREYPMLAYLFEATGFLIIAQIGAYCAGHLEKLNLNWILVIGFILILSSLVLQMLNSGKGLESSKYPPYGPYLTYGIGAVLVLYRVSYIPQVSGMFKTFRIPITWCSKYSLELYYWHVIIVFLIGQLHLSQNWILLSLAVIPEAFLITYIQTRFLPRFFTLGFK